VLSRSARLLAVALLALLASCQRREGEPSALVVIDDAGDTVRLAHPARRIVSLIPATTEILFAIGDGSRMVGRTRWCDYPAEAAAVPDVGDGISPNLEAVLARSPDLVVMYHSGSNAAAAERLRALGVPTVRLSVDRLSDVPRVARLLGGVTERQSTADSLAAEFDRELERATAQLDRNPIRVLIVAWDQPPMAIGGGSFLSEMVTRAGGRNIFEDLTSPAAQISIEAVVERRPDALLVSSDGPPAIASRPEWRTVPAVRDNHFVHVTSSAFSRPSPRAPGAIRELAASFRAFAP
jgi:ABC-type Fe3+-hydroxamate transport system substrate-binding protein